MKRVNSKEVKENDLMAMVTFVKVDRVLSNEPRYRGGDERIAVIPVDNGTPFEVQGKELIEEMYSADQAQNSQEVTKTELAEKLVTSYNVPFTVVFEKADKSLRTLRGRLVSSENLLGRSMCEDLDLRPSENRLRLVDHRTLLKLTVYGVEYRLKK